MSVLKTVFLSFEQVLVIHDNQIELYGGKHGLRDITLLESALMRPQMGIGGKDFYPTRFYKAAVLMHSLIMNHAFVDGNKRTGVVSALVFLEINGCVVKAKQEEISKLALAVAEKKMVVDKLAKWFEERVKVY